MHSQHKNLIEKIKEVLPKEKDEYLSRNAGDYNFGYNQALQDCISSLPQVMEVTKNYLLENMSSDHSNCPIKETCIGYQNAISDIINLLSEESKVEEIPQFKGTLEQLDKLRISKK